MKSRIIALIIPLLFNGINCFSQTFTNSASHSFTTITPYSTTYNVTGVAPGKILRQVTLKFGDGSIYSGDLSKTTVTLKNPAGDVVTLMNPANFTNTSNSSNVYFNITLRDNSSLYTPGQWVTATGNTISNAYPFDYGYWKSVGSYSSFTGTNNGTWELTIVNTSGSSFAREYISSELVFGDAFDYVDIRTTKPNQSCATKQCMETGTIYLGSNIGYPNGQPNIPLNVGSCTMWNAAQNNSAWFYFTASASTVELSVSGMSKKIESVVAVSSDCNNYTLANGGCPSTMYNSSANFTQYYNQNYAGGYSQNHGYQLTGLTPGQEYILILDGLDGTPPTESNFYIEIESGADGGCCPIIDLTVSTTKTGCTVNNGSISITPGGGASPYTYDFDDGNGFVSSNSVNGLAAGTYNVVVKDNNGCDRDTTITIESTSPPVIDNIAITEPSCGASDGEIVVTASGGTGTLHYSIDGGSTTQSGGTFSNLTGGSITITVIDDNGCQVDNTINLNATSAPSIDNFNITPPTCAGACDGAITAVVTGGTPPYTYAWEDALGNPVGTNSATLNGACDGDYTLTVTDNGGGSSPITVYTEDFNSGAPGWTLNNILGSEGTDANHFEISDNEGGVAPPGCGTANNGDPTLYVSSIYSSIITGAAYLALSTSETHRQAESPVINTTGYTGLTLNFDFIANGDIPNDQATVWYNDGSVWTQLGTPLYSGTAGCAPQGTWTAYSQTLPASCDNNPNLQIAKIGRAHV